MWAVKYHIRRIIPGKNTISLGTIEIIGEHASPKVYIKCLWKNIGGTKMYNPIQLKSFDKRKYHGDERLCKYLKRYFGVGYYSLQRPMGKKRGTKSVFYGYVGQQYFIRYKRDILDTINPTGLSPHLSSTIPIGGKHNYEQ